MSETPNNQGGGLGNIGNLNFSVSNVVQLAVFICALLAQWYGLKAQLQEQRIYFESDRRIWELKIQVLESKFQALEYRFNSQSNQNNRQK